MNKTELTISIHECEDEGIDVYIFSDYLIINASFENGHTGDAVRIPLSRLKDIIQKYEGLFDAIDYIDNMEKGEKNGK